MKFIKVFEDFMPILEMKLTSSSLINQIIEPSFIKDGILNLEKSFQEMETYLNGLSEEKLDQEIDSYNMNNLFDDLIKMSKATGTTKIEKIIKSKQWLLEVRKELEKETKCRKLVLSDKSYKNLTNYKAPKDIRIDVLKSLPNRKDIIQLNPNRVIKYIKTNNLLSVQTFWDNKTDYVDSYFFCIDLNTGLSFYNNYDDSRINIDRTIDKTKLLKFEDMMEKYYSEFITCVTYIELTDVTLDICLSNSSRGDIMKGNDLKNQLNYNVIQVNSNWNISKIHIGDKFGVSGHWRLTPVGPAGNKQYKFILINPYEKTGIINRKAGKNLNK
jgi:hypothetical protein